MSQRIFITLSLLLILLTGCEKNFYEDTLTINNAKEPVISVKIRSL